MSKVVEFFQLVAGVAERLKSARLGAGLTQQELAEATAVSRITQLSYEGGGTAPSIEYLQRAQGAGLDVPYVLFGRRQDEYEDLARPGKNVDWELAQQAYEHVEFFCARTAPQCPSRYRWELVAHLYKVLCERVDEKVGPLSNEEAQGEIARIWDRYARA